MNDLLLIPTRVPTRYGEFLLYRVALLAFKERSIEKADGLILSRSRLGVGVEDRDALSIGRRCESGNCEYVRRCSCSRYGFDGLPSSV